MPTSNWSNLKAKLASSLPEPSKESLNLKRTRPTDQKKLPLKKKRTDINEHLANLKEHCDKETYDVKRYSKVDTSKYIGLDCEMVGIGPNGKTSALARCCLVDFDGKVVYDSFVRPPGYVTDFRTKYSGVRKKNLREGEAVSFKECQEAVAELIKGKVLVGHALKNDLDVLMLSHHKNNVRDTARYKPYMRPGGKNGGKFKPRSLKDLAKQFLGITIQTSEHDPGEDARTAMELYKLAFEDWEKSLKA